MKTAIPTRTHQKRPDQIKPSIYRQRRLVLLSRSLYSRLVVVLPTSPLPCLLHLPNPLIAPPAPAQFGLLVYQPTHLGARLRIYFLPVAPDKHGLVLIVPVRQMAHTREVNLAYGNPADAEGARGRPEEGVGPRGRRSCTGGRFHASLCGLLVLCACDGAVW